MKKSDGGKKESMNKSDGGNRVTDDRMETGEKAWQGGVGEEGRSLTDICHHRHHRPLFCTENTKFLADFDQFGLFSWKFTHQGGDVPRLIKFKYGEIWIEGKKISIGLLGI